VAPAEKRRLALTFLAVALLVALDLWSKAAVFAWLAEHPERLESDCHPGHLRLPLAGSWLAFMRSLNPGMAWGFDRLPPHVLVIGRILASVLLVWLLVRNRGSRPWLSAALALILAGALGNLHDNLFTDAPGRPYGMVRDFIDVYFAFRQWHFPTFNVADSCISVGAVILFVESFARDRSKATHVAPAAGLR
jgi:lipoprotein signal peptidase